MTEMDDRAVEALLKRYRPVGPPPEFALVRPPGRTWPWAVAAAALLALTIGLHATARPPVVDPLRDDPAFAERVSQLAAQFGGDLPAHQIADWMVRRELAEKETGMENRQ